MLNNFQKNIKTIVKQVQNFNSFVNDMSSINELVQNYTNSQAFINLDKKGIRVASIYAPNGNPINSEKYSYKIEWLKKFFKHAEKLLEYEEYTFLGGDFNICPKSLDAADENLISNDAIYTVDVKSLYKNIINFFFCLKFCYYEC